GSSRYYKRLRPRKSNSCYARQQCGQPRALSRSRSLIRHVGSTFHGNCLLGGGLLSDYAFRYSLGCRRWTLCLISLWQRVFIQLNPVRTIRGSDHLKVFTYPAKGFDVFIPNYANFQIHLL